MSRSLDEIITCKRGVHLRGTPLWIDPELKHELVALTTIANQRLPAHVRTLASPGIAAALERLGARAPVLPAEFGRWVGLGGVQIQTVDLGMQPEGEELSSAVLVGVAGRRILLTGALHSHHVRWPSAEHVVARLVAPGQRGAPLHQVVRALVSFVRQAHDDGERAVLTVDAPDLAAVLARELVVAGLDVTYGGRFARMMADSHESGGLARVVLRPCNDRIPARGRLGRVDTGLGCALRGRNADATFRLKWFADPEAVAQMMAQTHATGLTLIGAGPVLLEAVREQVGPAVSLRGLGQPLQLDFPASGPGT